MVALGAVSNALERRRAVAEPVSSPEAASRRRGPGLVANLAVMALILGLPVAVLVERSLSAGRGGGYTLRNYTAMAQRVNLLPDTALAALGNSLMFAAPAAALALLVGGTATLVVMRAGGGSSRRIGRAFDIGLTLPLGTSAVTVGLGFLLVLDRPPVDIRTSLLVVPIAHAVVGIPFVVRTLVPMLRTINPRVREAVALMALTAVAVFVMDLWGDARRGVF